jgi:hypothetical protein
MEEDRFNLGHEEAFFLTVVWGEKKRIKNAKIEEGEIGSKRRIGAVP